MGLSSEEKQMLIDLALEQDSFGRYSAFEQVCEGYGHWATQNIGIPHPFLGHRTGNGSSMSRIELTDEQGLFLDHIVAKLKMRTDLQEGYYAFCHRYGIPVAKSKLVSEPKIIHKLRKLLKFGRKLKSLELKEVVSEQNLFRENLRLMVAGELL